MGAYDDKVRAKGQQAGDRKAEKADDAPFRGYINLNLTPEQKSSYEEWSKSGAVWERLEVEADAGIHLSLRRDPKSGGFLASATQRSKISPNAGLVVTARGKEAWVAWSRMLFILDLLSAYKKWEDCQPIADPDRW